MWSLITRYVVLLPVFFCHLGLGDRQKRQSHPEGPITLTAGQIERIVDTHNLIRRKETATNMALMEWHDGLAAVASNFTKECVWTMRPKDELHGIVQGFNQLSENVDISPNYKEIEELVKKWSEESNFYRYETAQCIKVCGHYTQVVWATSHSVGCSISYCSNLRNPQWGQHGGYLVSCVYGPGGNIGNMRPYTRGTTACGNCGSDFPYCIDGLCSKRQPPSTTESPTVTTPMVTVKPISLTTATSTRPEITTKLAIGSASRHCSLIGGFTGLIYIFLLMFLTQT